MGKREKNLKRKRQRLIIKCIIGLNITICVGLAIYLIIFFAGKKKPATEEIVSNNSVSEDIVSENKITEEEFLASWDALDSDLSQAKVGDIVLFGRYEQDSVSENFLEPIEWDVLAVSDNSVLLISHYIIDKRAYHEPLEYITWEASTLRQWLNNDFVSAAFNDGEKAKLKTVSLSNADSYEYFEPFYGKYNMQCGALGGNETEDKVFLLNYNELIDYYNLTPSEDFIAYVSEDLYAEPTKATGMSSQGYSSWWLRSPGDNFQFAMYVSADYLQATSGSVDDNTKGIRPCMWVNF